MIILFLLFIARSSKAFSDIVKSSWTETKFSEWKPTSKFRAWFIAWAGPGSQLLKWKVNAADRVIKYTGRDWYYFGIYPDYVERFTYSSTYLVALNDAWHTSECLIRNIYLLIAVLFGVEAAGFHMWGIQVPNGVDMILGGWLGGHSWFPVASLVVSYVILGTIAQLIGFTLVYNYILRKDRSLRELAMLAWKYLIFIFAFIMAFIALFLIMNEI